MILYHSAADLFLPLNSPPPASPTSNNQPTKQPNQTKPNQTKPINHPNNRAGALSRIPSAAIRAQLDAATDRQQVEALAQRFVGDIRAGRHQREGWGNSMYGISKVGVRRCGGGSGAFLCLQGVRGVD